MDKRKRVFVTGASSELMQHMLPHFNNDEFEVVGLSRSAYPKNNPEIKWVKGEMENPTTFKAEIAEADIIIHAAAITHTKSENEYFKVNYEGTLSVINSIPPGRHPRFVFISSRVAGEDSGAYGVSKLRAEKEVERLENWLIIRPSEVYGGSKKEGIDKTISSALQGGLQLCPVNVPSKMYPIHVSDAAEAIAQLVIQPKSTSKIVFLNGANGYSFSELLQMIKGISGKSMTIIPIPKWFLQIVASASRVLPFSIGFVPDQVARLYSIKEHDSKGYGNVQLEEYIKSLIAEKDA